MRECAETVGRRSVGTPVLLEWAVDQSDQNRLGLVYIVIVLTVAAAVVAVIEVEVDFVFEIVPELV